ncbi:Uncharacterized protein Rs2_48435 [Raphanus sativus]|nr:Uncharacterized protein Rs2_48435 [Raphanus sativus]
MTDSAYRVTPPPGSPNGVSTTSLLPLTARSDPFKMGLWNWKVSNLSRENPPVASFVLRVVSSSGERKAFSHPEVIDKKIKTNEDFLWTIEVPFNWKKSSSTSSFLTSKFCLKIVESSTRFGQTFNAEPIRSYSGDIPRTYVDRKHLHRRNDQCLCGSIGATELF